MYEVGTQRFLWLNLLHLYFWEFLSQSAKHSGEKTDLLMSAALSLLLTALIINTLLDIEHTCMLAIQLFIVAVCTMSLQDQIWISIL